MKLQCCSFRFAFAFYSGIVKGELWFEYHPRLCTAVASICVVSCLCSLASIMAISINRYIHICKNQVSTMLISKVTLSNKLLICLKCKQDIRSTCMSHFLKLWTDRATAGASASAAAGASNWFHWIHCDASKLTPPPHSQASGGASHTSQWRPTADADADARRSVWLYP